MKKIILISCLLLIALTNFAQGQYIQGKIDQIPANGFELKPIFTPKNVSDEPYDFQKELSEFTLASVPSTALKSLVDEYDYAIEVHVPYNGSLLTLQLIKSNFINEKTVFTTQQSTGKSNFPYKMGAYYYGVVKDMPNTVVGISFFENDIIGTIAMPEGNIVIGKSNIEHSQSEEYIIYNDRYLKMPNNTSCGMNDAMSKSSIPVYETKKTRTITTNCVKFYVECDYYTYQSFGNSVVNTTNFATGLFNLVSTLYINDSISTGVSQVNVWTTVDPYDTANGTYNALTSFSSVMSGGFNGDLAQLITRKGLGGGIAWLDVLCASSYYRCAVSASLGGTLTPLPTYSWNTMVVTHESGHNMASPHTHACAWNGDNTRIDNCAGNYNVQYQEGTCNSFPPNPVAGGTIMSYCHLQGVGINLSLGFGPQPGALIRTAVNTSACLSECINCSSGITITGTYSNPLTESNTWIKSSGQTTILNTAQVTLDPNPYTGYALFSPSNNNDFFVANPISNNSYFVSQAYDGCSGDIPQLPYIGNKDEETTGGSTLLDNAFTIYPNPTSDNIRISNHTIENESIQLEIYSMDGKLLASEKNILFNNSYLVSLNNISTGLYFIKVIRQTGIHTLKFQKY
jgi:hypothetical protein